MGQRRRNPEQPQGQGAARSQHARALELAIINAFFLPGSAAHFAAAFSTGGKKLVAADITRIWAKAKENGELPKISRPHNGPRGREMVRA